MKLSQVQLSASKRKQAHQIATKCKQGNQDTQSNQGNQAY